MHYIKGYFKTDLKVFTNSFHNPGMPAPERRAYPNRIDYYEIFVMLKGTAKVNYNKQKFTLTNGNMIICDVGAKFAFNFLEKEDISYLDIIVHPSVLSEVSEDLFFLRSLQDFPDNQRVFDLHDNELLYVKPCVESLLNCLNLDLGRPHILPRIKSIISELDIFYDRKYATEIKSTDSIPVQIIHYVDRHFTENITYKFICEKFSVSEPTVRRIFKSHKGKSLREYIESLRMEVFEKRIKDGENIIESATLCGYNDYTTFLKAYKKTFGKLPKESKKKQTEKYPLS